MKDYQIQRLFEIFAEYPEGFTYDLKAGQMVTNGYIVAYAETQNCFGFEGFKTVLSHVNKNGQIIGGWLDSESNLFYFDSVKRFENLNEALDFGKKNAQIAIFDLYSMREIRL